MTSHLSKIVLAGVLVISLPVVLVQAQSEEPTAEPVVEEETSEVVPEEIPAEEPAEEGSEEETPTPEGEVLGAETGEGEETATEETSGGEETTPLEEEIPLELELEEATSTATTTPPFEPPPPPEEKLLLQPVVEMSQSGNSLTVSFKVENLSCKDCDKSQSPENVPVSVYYTPWYPNDGPENIEETDSKQGKNDYQAPSISSGSASDTYSWSAELPAGHYYLVVVVDPDNEFGAYRTQRTEIIVE